MTATAPDPLARYHRQMLLPDIGRAGQERLSRSRALIVGCGALGSVAAEVLCRAGVGMLRIVDRDVVEPTNLQRQVLYDEADARDRLPKAQAAGRRLGEINREILIDPIAADVNPRTVEGLIGEGAEGAGVVLDCTDNFLTRYLLNDACVKMGVPLVYGGAVATHGMMFTVVPGSTACVRCLFPDPPAMGTSPTCDTAGVLMVVTGIVGMTQAGEAMKILLGRRDLVASGLRTIDVWSNQQREIGREGFGRNPSCPCCGVKAGPGSGFEFLEGLHHADEVTLCGADAVQIAPPRVKHDQRVWLDLQEMGARLALHGRFEATRHMVRGTLDRERDGVGGGGLELTIFRDGRAIVRGTTDAAVARAVYSRYVGD